MSITLRPATAADQKPIKALIREVGINPMNLNWERFIVAEDRGEFAGCVQVKQHDDGARELASLAVMPQRQGQGIGRRLIEAVLEQEAGELYLTCRKNLAVYYGRFGFKEVNGEAAPRSFKLPLRMGRLLAKLGQFEGPAVMKLERPPGRG